MSSMTVDDRDGRLSYSGGWYREGWNHDNSITLASTNDLTASVTLRFPVAARAVSYYGMRRSNGGLYDICFDCSGGGGQRFQIDAYDRSDNGQRPPALLWRQEWSGNGIHTVTVSNKADSRGVYTNGQTGNSQLVLDRFVLEIAAAPPPPPPPPPPSPTPTPTPTPKPNPPSPNPNPNPNPIPNPPDPTSTPRNAQSPTDNPDPNPTSRSSPTSRADGSTDSGTSAPSSNTATSETSSPPSTATRTGTADFAPGNDHSASLTSLNLPHNAAGTHIDHAGNLVLDRESKVPLGAILGAVFGVLAVIACIILFCYYRRRKTKARMDHISDSDSNDPTNPFNNAILSGTISPDMSQLQSSQHVSNPSGEITQGDGSGPLMNLYSGPSGKAGYTRNWSPDPVLVYSSGSSPTHRPSESVSGYSSFHASEGEQTYPSFNDNISRGSLTSDSHLGQMGSSRALSMYSQTSSQGRLLAPLRRVEVDAGPVVTRMRRGNVEEEEEEEDDIESLPPDYGDVFGRSSRGVSSSRVVRSSGGGGSSSGGVRSSAARSTMTVATTNALSTFEEIPEPVPEMPTPLRRRSSLDDWGVVKG